jgi:hypothetical protein
MSPQEQSSARQSGTVTGFGVGRSAQIARVLVVDMVLWPGVLFLGGTLLLTWHARESLPALVMVTFATLVSVVVGVRQWGVMLGAVFAHTESRTTAGARDPSDSGEGFPRLTGRGETE